MLERYANTPGVAAHAPSDWPAGSKVKRDTSRYTLVVFAHPQCPCTRSSLEELGRLLRDRPTQVHAIVLVEHPSNEPMSWTKGALWRRAKELSGVTVAVDENGAEAIRFGAVTSGQVLAYDPAGRLVFKGGITAARGHEGDNAGRDEIAQLLVQGGKMPQTPVFGCSLR